MKKPNFFIIGAPKCGTTSLAAWLAEHPNIYFSPRKEPHYFNKDGLTSTETLEEYESLFAGAGPDHLAVGEGSTHYLYSREAVPRILEYNPEARFIVCLRNPVEMAPSLHSERVWQGRETVKRFEDAWRLQTARRLGKHIPLTLRRDPERLQYGAYCRLGEQLHRVYQQVPRERVLPLLLDDIRENPKREYGRVLNFLGVPDDGRNAFPVYNRRKHVKSVWLSYAVQIAGGLKRRLGIKKPVKAARLARGINTTTPENVSLSPAMRKELRAYFTDDIALLGKLINQDLKRWLE